MTRAIAPTLTHAEADAVIRQVYGVNGREELDALQTKPFDEFAPLQAVRIVDGEMDGGVNIGELVERWAREDSQVRHAGGRPTSFSPRSLLIVMLMHAIAHEDLTLRHMADTLATRLSREKLNDIGLPSKKLDADVWYRRLDTAHKALIKSINTHPYPVYTGTRQAGPPRSQRITRHRKLTVEQLLELDRFQASMAETVAVRQVRLDDLMFELVANTIHSAGTLMKDFNGDIALDATFTPMFGGQTRKDRTAPARSTTPEAGLYRRGGDHKVEEKPATGSKGGKRKEVSKFGFETEVLTTTVGDGHRGPDLIIGVTVHRPGEITMAAETLIPRFSALGYPSGNCSVDRAYSNLNPANFHIVMINHGYEFVFDYPKDELGIQTSYASGMKTDKDCRLVRDNRAEQNHFIMVEGTWYLHFMPELLINAVKHSLLDPSHPDWIDEDTLQERLAKRTKYQLTRFGTRDSDGYQRYTLPNPSGYIAVDPITAEILNKPKARTVSIPLKEGIRWAQKFPYRGPEWQAAYNLRSTVERKNNLLKHPTLEDLANPHKRQYRGHAPTALVIALMAASHNIGAVDHYLRAAEGIHLAKTKHRQTRDKQRPYDSRIEGAQKQRDGRKAA